jgi:hypothetical protein
VKGSVDGLLVFDSLGGPALAERVGPSGQWRRLVLYRIVPGDAAGEPLTVTFALTGLGEARIDDVSIRVLDRGGAVVPSGVASFGTGTTAFPSPTDLLGPPSPGLPPVTGVAPPAVAGAPSSAAAWPGMKLDWPKLPFGQQSNAPPPGPGGGRVDPFKRAGMGVTQPVAPSPPQAVPQQENPSAPSDPTAPLDPPEALPLSTDPAAVGPSASP